MTIVYACSKNDPVLGDERCPHYPRVTPAIDLEQETWNQVSQALLDIDYIRTLVDSHIAQQASHGPADTVALQRKLTDLEDEETRIVRGLAQQDDLHRDVLVRALSQAKDDSTAVRKELQRLGRSKETAFDTEAVHKAIERLVALARARLNDPTQQLMAEIYDLVELDLVRVEHRTFQGSANLPLPEPAIQDEVWEEALPSP
jgi:hypothetical protein